MSEQRTAEWHAARCGKFTGSRFVHVLDRKNNGEPTAKYHECIWQVVVERLMGEPMEGPVGYALQWGTDVEPYAREAYELETGRLVQETGFIEHPIYPFAGCSPDGLISDDGGLEMKCPKSSIIHAERFLSGLPEEYRPQIQGCMWVTGRQWWDFASYDPRMPPSHRLLVIRVERDQEYIDKLQAAVIEAEARAQALYNDLIRKAA